MVGFADSFWSADYAGGLGVLFGKLQQGCAENQQVLTIARMRAEAEDLYGTRLADIGPAADKIAGGFNMDDGATVKKAYDGVRAEMDEAAKDHKKIANSIRELVVNPFKRWADAHANRTQSSQDDLQMRIKHHDKQADVVRKLRSNYFNKCRLVEDIEEENKLAFQEKPSTETSPLAKAKQVNIPTIQVQEEDAEDEPIEIGDEIYQPEQVKKMLSHAISTVPVVETKVPILGTYQNTTAGCDIVDYLQKNLGATSVSQAERIGQDLVDNGFLRLIGNVGNTFANSSKMFYQWRPKSFKFAGITDKKVQQPLARSFSIASTFSESDSPVVNTIGETLSGWVNNNPNETPAQRLRREAHEADARYKAGVRKLDLLRCQLEEAIIDHLKFMERCELDRLKAIKSVILDFSGAIGNAIPSLQSTVDKMMLYQETVQPLGDLRYLLENYRTGGFAPKVQVYDNYYNSADEQTFGVDLEARARADKKRVPNVVTSTLTFLDNHYPDMEGDEARRGIWLVDVPLHLTHRLRDEINNGMPVTPEILGKYEIPIVASVLKLYLLELPDSLVSSHVYEIIKTIYSTPASESSDSARIAVLQNTLIQLRLANIATLDALMTHFTRLIELTSADETYITSLAQILAPCILRPRLENSLTMDEKHAYRLVRDLFAHKSKIFSELKRASSLSHPHTVAGEAARPRAVSSTDERSRREIMEARQKAMLEAASTRDRDSREGRERVRAISPNPMKHRRDRSSGGPETRFPVATTSSPKTNRSSKTSSGGDRTSLNSLEVPGANAAPIALDSTATEPSEPVPSSAALNSITNGSSGSGDFSPVPLDGPDDGLVKKNSLGRSGHVSRQSLARKAPGSGLNRRSVIGASAENSEAESAKGGEEVRGVSLTDKPMDD